jgi:cytochrome c553
MIWLAGLLLAVALPVQAVSDKTRVPLKAAPLLLASLAKGDAQAGKVRSDDERCQECHGRDGNADDIEDGVANIGKFPKLAGQLPGYIAKQIRNFRSGERNHETMAIMARGIDDAALADIAAYFASQPRKHEGRGDNALGRKLFAEGDASRAIPACAACHGERGQGAAKGEEQGEALYPAIGGQHRRYLHKQLHEWKAGVRANSAGGLMNNIAGPLSDAEIDALADYISSL